MSMTTAMGYRASKLVVEPRMIKELMVEEICGSRCGDDRDRVYQINIEPVAYERENEKQSKVNMMFGFAPYYVIPAKPVTLSTNSTMTVKPQSEQHWEHHHQFDYRPVSRQNHRGT